MDIIKTRTGVYGVIINDNKIALVKKKNGGYKGKYDLPGGGIKHKEDVISALKREIKEEIGRDVVNYKLLNVYTHNIYWQMDNGDYEDLHQIGIIYIVKIDSLDLVSIDEYDTEYSKWIDINNIKEEDVTPFTWYALKEIQ